MTRQRHRNLSDIPQKIDREGNIICLNCGKMVYKKGQRKYCDEHCAHEFLVKNDHQAMRTKIIFKTCCTCAKCGKSANLKDPESMCGYVMDHIIPIALGGDEFDENNVQLLCRDCDKEKTAMDRKKIDERRRKNNDTKYD